eukprot:360774-Chlamydomonas_euryale.AAC.8
MPVACMRMVTTVVNPKNEDESRMKQIVLLTFGGVGATAAIAGASYAAYLAYSKMGGDTQVGLPLSTIATSVSVWVGTSWSAPWSMAVSVQQGYFSKTPNICGHTFLLACRESLQSGPSPRQPSQRLLRRRVEPLKSRLAAQLDAAFSQVLLSHKAGIKGRLCTQIVQSQANVAYVSRQFDLKQRCWRGTDQNPDLDAKVPQTSAAQHKLAAVLLRPQP